MSFAVPLPFDAQNIDATQLPGDLKYYNLTTGVADPVDHVGHDASAYDFGLSIGTPLLAIGTGTVVSAVNVVPNGEGAGTSWATSNPYGNFVTIRYDMGDGNSLYATYAHLELNSGLALNTVVHAGDRVGNVGLTGLTYGPHLHIQFGLTTVAATGGGMKADAAGDYDIVTFGDPASFVYNSNYNEDEYTYSSAANLGAQLHAQAISLSSGSYSTSGSVGAGYGTANWNSDDFYSFVAPSDGSVSVHLSGLSNDIDLRMLDGSGLRINQSINNGTSNEDITQSVTAGSTYFIHVDPYHYDSSNYSLSVSFTGSGAPDIVIDALDPGATSVGILGGLDTSFTVGNNGQQQSAPTTAHLYFSSTPHLNSGGVQQEIGTGFGIPALDPGKTYSTGISWIIPAVVSPGTWYVIVAVDPVAGEVRTDNDSDNRSFQIALCFRAGTHIETQRGLVTVEHLRIGELVRTHFGQATPVKWVGRRHINCRLHPQPQKVWPVRVCADAFGDGQPFHDLWLSPDHAVFVNDVLIPIKHLVNGISIEQVPLDEVTYYHVELPQHEVLLADGLPVESYLDTGDRFKFENDAGPIALYPDFSTRSPGIGALWEAHGCAPLIITGATVDSARDRINRRAVMLDRRKFVDRATL